MQRTIYKFERYEDRNLPLYAAKPKQRPLRVCPHYHIDAEFIRVLRGKVKLNAGTNTYVIEEGDIAFLPPMTFHEAFADDANASIDALVFHPSVLGKEIRFTEETGECYIFKNGIGNTEHWWNLIERTLQSFYIHGRGYLLEVRAYLLLIGSKLIECGAAELQEEKTPFLRIKPVVDYIKQNYNRYISIGELADMLCLCPDHFSRIFKKTTGKTPMLFITDYRITESMKLLSRSELSVEEIAQNTGFQNAAYFNRVFKQKMKMTPLGYRKKVNSL